MSVDALLLALSSIIRPTTLGAVYAMLSRPAARGLLRAYLITGLAFSVTVGIGVVVILHGYTPTALSTFWRAVLDIALGAAACGYAIGVGTSRRAARKTSRTTAWLQHRLDNLTASRAAMIGLVTHLPGLVYLAALNAISASAMSRLGAIAQVITYNLIWYSVAIAAFLVAVFRPAASQNLLEKANAMIYRRGRWFVVTIFGVIGLCLIGNGVSILRGGW